MGEAKNKFPECSGACKIIKQRISYRTQCIQIINPRLYLHKQHPHLLQYRPYETCGWSTVRSSHHTVSRQEQSKPEHRKVTFSRKSTISLWGEQREPVVEHRGGGRRAHSPAGSRITADVRLTSTLTVPSDTCTAPSAGSSSTLYFGSSADPCDIAYSDYDARAQKLRNISICS